MRPTDPHRPAYWLYHLLWSGLDWLFPPTCGGCGAAGERWCSSCRTAAPWIHGDVCPQCGAPHQPETCPLCRQYPPEYTQLRSAAVYGGPLRKAMIHLKYGGDLGLGEVLAQHLAETYHANGWQVDLVVAVPIGAQRKRERGYNQAGLLARPLAYSITVPYQPQALEKCRETRSQVGLNAQQRAANVAGAFAAVPALVRKKRVLLVDDVTTTGSTIRACAAALHAAGASAVFGLTLARAASPQADADDLSIPNP